MNALFDRTFDQQSLKIQNGLFHAYCINIYGIIQQNEKGFKSIEPRQRNYIQVSI